MGDFMGLARLELTLPAHAPATIERRDASGTITVLCEWTPRPHSELPELPPEEKPELTGTLKVTLISAQNLINLNCSRPHCASNPYCMVLCYPKSPAVAGYLVQPC